MTRIVIIHPNGDRQEIDAPVGGTVMEVVRDSGVSGTFAECGGNCSCATCHVYVDRGQLGALPRPSATEEALLDATAAPRMPESRLSCQIELGPQLETLTVRLPEEQV